MFNSTYTALPGDTFSSISRKTYGTEQNAALLQQANPNIQEPIQPGSGLLIPSDPNAPVNLQQATITDSNNETSVLIRGRRFRYWEKITIQRSIDSVDQIGLVAPFESDNPDYREAFRPFRFDPIEVNVNGQPLFTGRIVPVRPSLSNAGNSVAISAYSDAGLLSDTTAPGSKAPLEFDEMNLQDIATSLAKPYGVGVQFDDEPGPAFERVALNAKEKVMPFLAKLAKQRGLVISSTPRGALLFRKSVDGTGQPIAVFEQGQSPMFKIEADFNEQEYYSSVTGVEPQILFLPGEQYTVKNPYLDNVQRPHVFDVPDVQGGDLKEAVAAKLGRMFANAATYTITVPTWRDPKGNLWEPNTVVKVTAPGVMIYDAFKFIIRTVQMEREGDVELATLNLILPGGFSSQIPYALPWGESIPIGATL